jgi:hypothetical protein
VVPHEYTEPHAAAFHLGAHDRLLLAVEQLKHGLLQVLGCFALRLVEARIDRGRLVAQPGIGQSITSIIWVGYAVRGGGRAIGKRK